MPSLSHDPPFSPVPHVVLASVMLPPPLLPAGTLLRRHVLEKRKKTTASAFLSSPLLVCAWQLLICVQLSWWCAFPGKPQTSSLHLLSSSLVAGWDLWKHLEERGGHQCFSGLSGLPPRPSLHPVDLWCYLHCSGSSLLFYLHCAPQSILCGPADFWERPREHPQPEAFLRSGSHNRHEVALHLCCLLAVSGG